MPHHRKRQSEEDKKWQDYATHPSQQTRDQLITHYEGLVWHVVKKFSPPIDLFRDYFQVGIIGLINAIDNFDPTRGNNFTSFAFPSIEGTIKNYLRDELTEFKCRGSRNSFAKLQWAEQCYEAVIGHAPASDTHLAEFLGCPADAIWQVRAMMPVNPASLETIIFRSDQDDLPLSNALADDTADPAFSLDRLAIRETLARMPDQRLRLVLELRFFEELPQAIIAERLGISQMHVSRLEKRGLNWLAVNLDLEGTHSPSRKAKRIPKAAELRRHQKNLLREFTQAVEDATERYGKRMRQIKYPP